jgi:hypothetical protein
MSTTANDGRKIISDTYGLKPRDRAIRSQMFRTFRHQQQPADGPRKYFEISSTEDERFSHKYSAYFKSQTAQSSVGQCDRGHEKAVSRTYVLQHQEFAIRSQTCSTFCARETTIVSSCSWQSTSRNHQRYLRPEVPRRCHFDRNVCRIFRQQESTIVSWSA